ncbi:MAG: ATP-binding cassette domain-containing protein [Verrucomicrobiae bacterium]|nr:ATP-binding cassette domain-containing protein [Verrucomicrobiae bacterium]
MAAIEAMGLTKVFRSYRKRQGLWGGLRGLIRREYDVTRAADGVSFRIEEGELVGFLGPNGAGKTTVLKMLSGLIHPTEGTARVLGFVPWERKNAYRRQFSLVMGQKNQLWWDLPAGESFALNREIYGVEKRVFQERLDELLTLLDVRGKLNVMVRELSLGERMKMELIAALLHGPRVVFLDEPTIGLDVVSQKKVREFVRHHNRNHRTTIVLTSHYMADIEALCERVIMMDHGRIFFDGKLAELAARHAPHKVLTLVLRNPVDRAEMEAHGEILECAGSMVKLSIPRERAGEVCRRIFMKHEVEDLSMEEAPIEDVVRDIFSRKAGDGA